MGSYQQHGEYEDVEEAEAAAAGEWAHRERE